MNNVIFKHEECSAFHESYLDSLKKDGIEVKDSNINNIVIYKNGKEYKYSIPYNEIKRIIEITRTNDELFHNSKIDFPPILDGSEHYIYISDTKRKIEITAFNLWYFLEEESTDMHTINLINYIKKIQQILYKNNIKYKILCEELKENEIEVIDDVIESTKDADKELINFMFGKKKD